MRVLSYNIHKGFSFGNTRYLLEEIRHSIRLVNADLVFLQEVVGENRNHHRRVKNWAAQQLEYLADEIWPHYAYGKNALYSHGHHGNAILSQQPFESFHNVDVSLLPTSQRGILMGKIATGVHVTCLHFGLFEFERRQQTQKLCEKVGQYVPAHEPLIIAGDFNDWRSQSHHTLLSHMQLQEVFCEKFGRLARSFPARLPLFATDRIYFRNLELIDADILSGHPWNKLSDHCALYAEFKAL